MTIELGTLSTVSHTTKIRNGKVLQEVVYTTRTGVAKVTMFNETKLLQYHLNNEGTEYENATIFGVAIKYPTGTKVWNGSMIYWPKTGNIFVGGGLDYRPGHSKAQIVGFYEVEGKYNSNHWGA